MAKTNTGLVAYAKAQLGKPYWYGTFGQIATEALYKSKKKQYPNQYIPSDFPSQYGHRVHDCVGLIKGYLWSDSVTDTPKYNAAQDVSANGMRSKCTKKGSISTIPEVEGVLVFLDGHVGVYIGDGYVIEARGHKYGVVKTKLKERPWTSWGYCPYIEYNSKANTSNTTETTVKTTTEAAKSYSESLAGTYKVTATSLNVRKGAGVTKGKLVVIPKGTKVNCYGYYTKVLGTNWLYVQFEYKGKTYTGFASSKYLEK